MQKSLQWGNTNKSALSLHESDYKTDEPTCLRGRWLEQMKIAKQLVAPTIGVQSLSVPIIGADDKSKKKSFFRKMLY